MDTQNQTQPGAKKPYTTPRLADYGNVRSLTQAGTRHHPEGVSMPNGIPRPSERRVKENIVRVGSHPLGIGLYLFDYKPEYRKAWGAGRQFGVMVDEVEKVVPEAVFVHADGYKIVDYARLGIVSPLH